MVDARENAPRAATRDMFLDESGAVAVGRSIATALAAGIPGEPAGFAHLANEYGRLPLKQALRPPFVWRAKDSRSMRVCAAASKPNAHLQRRRRAALFAQGRNAADRRRHRQRSGADAERSGGAGTGWLLQGPVARKLVEGVRKLGGVWSMEDLAQYEVKERSR